MANLLARIGDAIRGEVVEGQLVDRAAPNLPMAQRRQAVSTQKRGADFQRSFNRLRYMGSSRHSRQRAEFLGSASMLAQDLSQVREQAIQVARVNPHAAEAIRVLTDWTIGSGLNMTVRGRNKTIQKRIEEAYKRWFLTPECDSTRHANFYELTRLAYKTYREQGEVLVRLRPRYMDDGLAVPLAVEVIDPALFYDGGVPKVAPGNTFAGGIEFSPIGHPVAYWLYKGNPNDKLWDWTPVRVPVIDEKTGMVQITHLFERLFPGQIRGIPRAALVVNTVYEQQDLRYSILRRKRMEAKIGLVLKAPGKDEDDGSRTPLSDVIDEGGEYSLDTPAEGAPEPTDDPEDDERIDPDALADWVREGMLEDNMVFPLPAGWNFDSVVIQNVSDYKEFMADLHRTVAVGYGVPYAFLTADLQDVPFSGSKVGLLHFKAEREADQEYWIENFANFVWRGFEIAGMRAGLWAMGDVTCQFRANQFPSVEPQKDLGVIIMKLKHGLISPRRAASELGENLDELLEEIAEDKARLEALGIDLYGALKLAAAKAKTKPSAEGGEA